jgi:serine/threonine protein kinase
LANRHGVIHQDINPRNVLIDVFGNAKLIDFGLAYVKDAWQDAIEDIGGTVLYMSPEQAQRQHEQIDRRTDVFGLGALLYYLLTGQAPISGKSREEAFAKATRCDVDVEPLSAPGIPRSLRRICLQAMSRFPNERPASAEELAHQLDRVLARRKFLQLGAAMVAAAIVVPTAWSTFLPTTAVDPQLAIRVLRGETYLPLLNALPIRTLDRVQVCFNVPAGMEATLYTVDALGKPEQVQHWPPKPMQREVTFPSTDQNVEISGPTGTEVIVLCLDPSLDLQVYDLRIPPAPSEEKLQLPDWVIVEAKGNTITAVEQPLPTGQPRGFGTRHDATDPVEGTKERLKQLQTRLQSRCRAWSAVAFGHRV